MSASETTTAKRSRDTHTHTHTHAERQSCERRQNNISCVCYRRRCCCCFFLYFSLFNFFTPKNHATQIVRDQTCLQHGLPAWCVRVCAGVSRTLLCMYFALFCLLLFLPCKRVSLPLRWLPKQNKQIKLLLPCIGIGMQNLFLSTHALVSTHIQTLSRPLSAHTKLTLSLSQVGALLQNKAHVSVCLLPGQPVFSACALSRSQFLLLPPLSLLLCRCRCCCYCWYFRFFFRGGADVFTSFSL